jgi:hypothetical protein
MRGSLCGPHLEIASPWIKHGKPANSASVALVVVLAFVLLPGLALIAARRRLCWFDWGGGALDATSAFTGDSLRILRSASSMVRRERATRKVGRGSLVLMMEAMSW